MPEIVGALFVIAAIGAFLYWFRFREETFSWRALYAALFMMRNRDFGEHQMTLRFRPSEKRVCVKKYRWHKQDNSFELVIPKTDWSEKHLDRVLEVCSTHDMSCRLEKGGCSSERLVVDLGGDLRLATNMMMAALVDGLGVSSSDRVACEAMEERTSSSLLR